MAGSAELERLGQARQEIRDNADTINNMRSVLEGGGVVDFRNFEKAVEPNKETEVTSKAMQSAVTGNNVTDLNDLETQRDIMHPITRELSLSWGKIQLHKLSSRNTVKFHGFALSVVSAAAQRPQNGSEILGLMSINSVLAEDDTIAMKLCFYSACATADPGVLDMKQALKIGAEIFNACDSNDFVLLYATLSDMTGFDKVLKGYSAKKSPAASEDSKNA